MGDPVFKWGSTALAMLSPFAVAEGVSDGDAAKAVMFGLFLIVMAGIAITEHMEDRHV